MKNFLSISLIAIYLNHLSINFIKSNYKILRNVILSTRPLSLRLMNKTLQWSGILNPLNVMFRHKSILLPRYVHEISSSGEKFVTPKNEKFCDRLIRKRDPANVIISLQISTKAFQCEWKFPLSFLHSLKNFISISVEAWRQFCLWWD